MIDGFSGRIYENGLGEDDRLGVCCNGVEGGALSGPREGMRVYINNYSNNNKRVRDDYHTYYILYKDIYLFFKTIVDHPM